MAHNECVADCDELMQFIEDEARDEGPKAVAELCAFESRLRIAIELLAARTQAHMTQRELAAATGVQQAEISKIERGEIAPGVTTVDRLLRPRGRRLAAVADDLGCDSAVAA
jgi:DNA-binding XRE family transcriptional regulator